MTMTKPYRKIRKISILEENLLGHTVETLVENVATEVIAPKKSKAPNPNRMEVFRKPNNLRELFTIVHYSNNDFLTLWVNGGVHVSKFSLTLEDVRSMIDKLTLVYCILEKNRGMKHETEL